MRKINKIINIAIISILIGVFLGPGPAYAGETSLRVPISSKDQNFQKKFKTVERTLQTKAQNVDDEEARIPIDLLDIQAEKEWQSPGNPELFPAHFYPKDFAEQYLDRFLDLYKALDKRYGASAYQIKEVRHFFYAIGYTRIFTDTYKGEYVRILDSLINKDNELLLRMFDIAVKDSKLRHLPSSLSYTYFLRYPEQAQDFKSNILAILEEKRKTNKKKVEILIPGCAYGEEVVSWRWILETEIRPIVPDFDRFDFEFIGVEKNSDVYEKANSNLKYGFNIFSTLELSPDNKQQIMKRLDFMSHVNKNIEHYNKYIKIIFADILSQEFCDILATSDIVVMNNVLYQFDDSQRRKMAKQFKAVLDANPLLRIMGEGAPALKESIERLSAKEQLIKSESARSSI